ncbi:MAG: N-acetylglucosamine-6-phosphate deacetylase [Acidobacteria bacterium]|nr:N-acetylglucosamine-6-phosphate deacetylase [Acidobacteriota bacterium]
MTDQIKDVILSSSVNSGNAVTVAFDGETIASVISGPSTGTSGLRLAAGYIDVHNHGAVGIDVNEADTDGLIEIAAFLARHGVTAWLPTLVPDSDENYRRVIEAIDRLMAIQSDMPIAQAVGVHYEGVFANEKMCGALRPEFFKRFTGGEAAALPRLKSGVHMTTFAPEVEGGIELVRELKRLGWIASIGHTRADIETLNAAFSAGASHVTHFFNAMTGIHHRDVGVAGWALTTAGVTFDIIADGLHVNPKMLDLACRAKSPENVLLISDSVAPTGLGDGVFELWGENISVTNGRTQNERGSIAGSVITMHDAVRRMLSLGFSTSEVEQMASANPAKLLSLDAQMGAVEASKRADLVIRDENNDIVRVLVGGREVDLG